MSVSLTGLSLDSGSWHHIVITAVGTIASFYINGSFVGGQSLVGSVLDDSNREILLGQLFPCKLLKCCLFVCLFICLREREGGGAVVQHLWLLYSWLNWIPLLWIFSWKLFQWSNARSVLFQPSLDSQVRKKSNQLSPCIHSDVITLYVHVHYWCHANFHYLHANNTCISVKFPQGDYRGLHWLLTFDPSEQWVSLSSFPPSHRHQQPSHMRAAPSQPGQDSSYQFPGSPTKLCQWLWYQPGMDFGCRRTQYQHHISAD